MYYTLKQMKTYKKGSRINGAGLEFKSLDEKSIFSVYFSFPTDTYTSINGIKFICKMYHVKIHSSFTKKELIHNFRKSVNLTFKF